MNKKITASESRATLGSASEFRFLKRPLVYTVLFISSVAGSLLVQAGIANGQQLELEKQQALARFQKELAKRVVKDQGVRYALIESNQESSKRRAEPKDEKAYLQLAKRASDVDEKNLKWLKKQIAKYGFPDPSQIGQRSAEELYLLILHADRDRKFQKDCIGHMEKSSEWSDESGWLPRLKMLEMRASMPSSREFLQVKDPKKMERPETVDVETLEKE